MPQADVVAAGAGSPRTPGVATGRRPWAAEATQQPSEQRLVPGVSIPVQTMRPKHHARGLYRPKGHFEWDTSAPGRMRSGISVHTDGLSLQPPPLPAGSSERKRLAVSSSSRPSPLQGA